MEWKQRMHDYNENIKEKVDHASDTELKLDEEPQWKRLSLAEEDEAFKEEFKKVINESLSQMLTKMNFYWTMVVCTLTWK